MSPVLGLGVSAPGQQKQKNYQGWAREPCGSCQGAQVLFSAHTSGSSEHSVTTVSGNLTTLRTLRSICGIHGFSGTHTYM